MEKRNYKLYVHISPSNKRYYGITCQQNINRRWQNGVGYKQCPYFYRAINKYGWDNFKHIVLFDNLTHDEACLLEQCYIALYNTMNPKYGYNNTSGGEHGLHSEEAKKKISNSLKGKPGLKGKANGMYGKHHTEEAKRKISEKATGRKASEEAKKKMSEAHKGEKNPWTGQHHTEEAKKKMSEAKKNYIPWNKGKTGIYSQEALTKMRESKKGKYIGKNGTTAKAVLMFTKNGQFIRKFDCVVDANEYLGKPHNASGIMSCARGERNTAYGYYWCYLEDKDNYILPQNKCKKAIKCIELNLIFNSVAEANEYLGKNRYSSNIPTCAQGKTNTAWGYHWEYVTEEQEAI